MRAPRLCDPFLVARWECHSGIPRWIGHTAPLDLPSSSERCGPLSSSTVPPEQAPDFLGAGAAPGGGKGRQEFSLTGGGPWGQGFGPLRDREAFLVYISSPPSFRSSVFAP